MVYFLIFFTGAFYVFLLFYLYKGWKKIPEFSVTNKHGNFFVSIVVAFRNEEKNISFLLNDLLQQQYPENSYEIILVNDHSEDCSADIIKDFKKRFAQLYLIESPDGLTGKKAAIELGVSKAISELIITVDADCRMGPFWLKSLVSCYLQKMPKLIIGPVLYSPGNKKFEKIQALEFLSLVSTGAGATGMHRPIMCNGANLAFSKEIYLLVKNKIHQQLASGDDVFLLLAIKKYWRNEIVFLKSKEALVTTKPEDSLIKYLQQRKRWASKSRYYSDYEILTVAAIIGLFNLCILVLLCLSLYNIKYLPLLIFFWVLKFLLDFPLMYSFSKFFANARLMQYFWLAQLLYPFYMVFMIFYANIGKYRWKNRNYKLTIT